MAYELSNLKIYLKSKSFNCSGSNGNRQNFSRDLQEKEILLKNIKKWLQKAEKQRQK